MIKVLISFYFNKVHAMKPVDSIKKTLFFILCLIKPITSQGEVMIAVGLATQLKQFW